jgi:hypothetical protein
MRKLLEVERLPDWINLGIGVLLFVSPWLLRFTDLVVLSRNAWITGLVIMILSVSAILALKEWEEWYDIAIGAWVMAAPLILGFTEVPAVLVAHLILGGLLIVSAGWEIWLVRQSRKNG